MPPPPLSFQIYNVFGVLWTLFFISAMEQMIMAGAFAQWYFTMDKNKLADAPLSGSVFR